MMQNTRIFTLISLVSIVVLSCTSREVAFVNPTPSLQADILLPVNLNRNLDILWVIDNSGSMEAEQASLVANFPSFINVLESIQGGLPDLHMGIATTDIGAGGFACSGEGDAGILWVEDGTSSSCNGVSVNAGANYLSDILDPNDPGMTNRIRNYTAGSGGLADAFSCYATRGTSGCGFEQPLEAMRRALTEPTNIATSSTPGFLRQEAFLAVIFITDEDDCSASDGNLFSDVAAKGGLSNHNCFEHGVICEPDSPLQNGEKTNCRSREDSAFLYPVAEYAEFLKGLKDNDNQIIVAGIQGEPFNANGDPNVTVISGVDDRGTPGKDLEKLCPDANDNRAGADPGFRMAEFLGKFPQRSSLQSICESDLSGALDQIADLLTLAIGNPCIKGDLVDIDPNTAGIQPNCEVQFEEEGADPVRVPQCSSSPPGPSDPDPCWHVFEDASQCSLTASQLKIEIRRTNVNLIGSDKISCQQN